MSDFIQKPTEVDSPSKIRRKKKKKKRAYKRAISDNSDNYDSEMPGISKNMDPRKQLRMRHRNNKRLYLFYPEDSPKQYWDLFITLILLISCIIVPYRIAFGEIEEPLQWKMINYSIDSFFTIDIILIFNSAYHDSEYRIVEDRKVIAKKYL